MVVSATNNKVLMNAEEGVEVCSAGHAELRENRIAHNAACIHAHRFPGVVINKVWTTCVE